MTGEFYHVFDDDSELWCVFYSESHKALASYCDENSARQDAETRERWMNELWRKGQKGELK